jgi:hypothetical protein
MQLATGAKFLLQFAHNCFLQIVITKKIPAKLHGIQKAKSFLEDENGN